MKKISTFAAILLIVLLIWPFIHVRKHLISHEKPVVETIQAYPEPDFAKVMFLGLNAFAADLLFTKAQYYFGSHYITDRTYPLLEQMVKVIMALNKDLKFVITFAEAAISSMGTPEAIESANSLLKLGHELFPDDYFFVFNQGYNYFIGLGDMEKAYPLMYEGSRMEGAPERLFWMVSRATLAGGDYKLGYEYTKEKIKNTKDKYMLDLFNNELKQYSNLIVLSEAVEKYYSKTGKSPDKEMKELIKEKILNSIPEDVFGGEYYFDEQSRRVKATSDGKRYYKKEKENDLENKKPEQNKLNKTEPKQNS